MMEPATNVLVVSPRWGQPWCEALRRAHPGARVEVLDADPEQLRRELPRVARALRERQGQQRVYFLGAAFDRAFDPDDRAAVTRALDSGAMALAALLRGLHESGSHSFVLQVLTVGAHAATPLEAPHPCAAAVYGLLRVYVKELRDARVYCEDRALDELPALDANAWARACAARNVEKGLEELAIRGGAPLRRALERLQLDEAASPPLRVAGVYLVLGGAGGIGFELSKWLARHFSAKIAWIGRAALDSERQRRIGDVEELGGRVLYQAADAADEAALRECIAAVERELGPVEGAFHSALALDDKPIVQLDDAALREVLAPKTLGSLALWRALRHRPQAFLTFFSSSQALAANPGQANYAAGSAFQDAFAGWLSQHGLCPVRTINWGYWGSVGAVASPRYRARFAALGVHSIEPEQGLEAMKRILSNPVTQVLAFNGSEQMFRERGLLEGSECRVFDAAAPSTISVLDAAFPSFEFKRGEHRELDAHICELVLQGLQGLGAFTPADPALPASSSGASLGVLPKYAALWREFLRMLRAAGLLEATREGLRAARNVPLLDRAELARRGAELGRRVPEFSAVLQLAERCASELPQVLTGRKPATEVIFPRSSVELVEGIYKDNAVSDYFNALVVEATLRRLQQHLAGQQAQQPRADTARFRILEVGAGTGGTSRPLLEALAPFGHALEYVYTDVSRAFLIHGKKQYGRYPFVRFERCDVAEALAGQGLAPGSFDVVVATNVLHATPRIRQTLGNLKTALRGGGWLVINEATALRGFSTLIFGLLDGWWVFEDGEQRIAGSPLLSVELWDRALRSEGFRSVRALGEASDELPLEQHVIVAESDGVVRLREAAPARERAPLQERAPVRETALLQEPAPAARSLEPSAALAEPQEAAAPELLASAEQGAAVERAIASVAAVVGRVLEMPSQSIDPDERFSELGVDSVLAVEIASLLSEELGTELRSTELFNYGCVRDLAAHLAGRAAAKQPSGAQVSPPAVVAVGAQQAARAAAGSLLPLILTTIAGVLELDVKEVGPDEVLANLGVDSVLAVEISARLSEALGMEVRTADLFSHGSARELEVALAAQQASLAPHAPAPGQASASPRASTSAPAAPAPLVTSDFPDIEIDEEPRVAPRAAAAPSPASALLPVPASTAARASERPAAPVSARAERHGSGALPGAGEGAPRIAIIGMSGRFAGAANVEELWQLLREGKSAVRELPERWDLAALYGDDPPSTPPGFKARAGFLDDVLRFDALFFGITPKEAELMDPQQRLVLEEGFRALEDAGYSKALLKRAKCGAYIGAGNIDYPLVLRQLGVVDDPSVLTGNVGSILAARLAYALDLTGPAIAVDTACSSSLVAIHLACEALRNRSVDMAITGGVAVLNTAGFSVLAQRAGMLAPDGLCKAFDNRANGMVPGEGVGMLVLKRLDDALRDGDHIHGVIVGSGVNQDGRTNGITAPSAVSQAALLSDVYRAHAIDPESIDFVECHGTGTKLGDPIEVQALTDAFRQFTQRGEFCALGSVKTNIGHALSAAGVAGVLKVLLSLRHQQLPPSLHFEEPNEHIDFAASPFFVQRSLSPWPWRADRPRRSAVSAFGFSGTNAHLVLEEPPPPPLSRASEGPFVFALSARTRSALAARARDLAAWIDAAGAGVPAAHVAYTLLCRRTHHAVRWATVARDLVELRAQLQTWAEPGGPRSGALAEAAEQSGSSGALEAELGRYLIKELTRASPGQRSQKLEACAALFAKGVELDWRVLFSERVTISLPSYPFEGECHLPAPRARLASSTVRERSRPETELLLQKTWAPSVPVAPGEQAVEAISGRWLVLVDEGSSAIGAALREGAGRSLQRAGVAESCSGVELEVVELAQIESVSAAGAVELASVAHRSGPIRGVIDLADVWPAEGGVAERRTERLAFLQRLVAGWLDRNDGSPYGYFHFAQGASAGSGSTVGLRGAFFAGLPAVLASEHRSIRARSVAVDVEPGQLEPLLQIIAYELASADASVESSWRRGVRHLPTLVELRSGGAAPAFSGTGYWVITGATGGIGAALGKEWAARGVRRLALLAHRPLPPRAQWQALLAGEAAGSVDADTLARIRAIADIESRGASVRLYQGSLCDAAQLSSFFTACSQEWGAMQGVLHCAGAFVAGQNAFARRDLAEAARVLEPKVEGLQALYRALLPFAPEHFVLFSSIASLCPSLSAGIGEYALANGFMNRFAELSCRTGSPLRVQAIAWSNWAGIGFGDVDSPRFHALGLERHSPEEGIALLDQALRSGAPLVLAGKRDRLRWDSDRALRAHPASPASPRSSSGDGVSGLRPRPGPADAGSRRERAIVWLRELLARELRIPEASLHASTPFQDFGVDSILMVELLKRMESELRGQLDPSMFLEHPTLAQLAEHLLATNAMLAELVAQPAATAQPPEAQPAVESSPAGSSPATVPSRPREQSSRASERSRAIAIVGVGCNLPGARGKEAFWAALRAGYSGIREVPPSRWNAADLYRDRYAAGRSISKWGGFLDQIESFDAAYFGLSEEMAPQVDPLIRQLLEVSVECLADAGYRQEELAAKNAGIFIGARAGNYGRRVAAPTRDTAVALGQNFIAAHVAHFLDLRGPALVVDTACSSSLVSLHLACQSLRSHECDFAIAGGVDLLLDESPYLTLSEAKALSPSGRCYTFDVRANGFVPGEGAAVVLLKRLDAALADGDQIYAIIEGSAVNNDGRTMGVTTPNPEAQASVVRAALADAGAAAASLSYLEAHGTGTMIGDPIELKALTRVFRETTSDIQFCAIGSVKSNIGHLMSAAGIASVVKTVLCLKHGELVPSINCEAPNPRFAFADSPFYVATRSEAWPLHHGTRRAGISSFGFGGTNAHVILAERPRVEAHAPAVTRQPLGPVQFDRKRYWLDPPGAAAAARQRPPLLELTRRKPSSPIHTSAPNGAEPTYELKAVES